jgi:hypothetical protein
MDIDKSTGEMKFTPSSGKWYVSHLDKSFFEKQLYNSEIFTQSVLEKMEPIVNNYFKYKDLTEQEEMEKQFEEMVEGMDENGFIDSEDGNDLFS